jgi:hypothetical protein
VNYAMFEAQSMLVKELKELFPWNETILYYCDQWLAEWDWFLENGSVVVRADRDWWDAKRIREAGDV